MSIRKIPPNTMHAYWAVSVGMKALPADTEEEADRIVAAFEEAIRIGREQAQKNFRDAIGYVDCACRDGE